MIELVPRLRRGDDAAFEELVRTHTGRLLRVARRMLESEEDARDAVQETFIAAFRSIHEFESGALLATWLHRIVINACLMKLRTRRRKPEDEISGVETAAPQRSAEDEVQADEVRRLVRRSVARLPEAYREVVTLRDLDELSTEEAAARLGTTANAVKIRLHRGRQALRTMLEPYLRKAS